MRSCPVLLIFVFSTGWRTDAFSPGTLLTRIHSISTNNRWKPSSNLPVETRARNRITLFTQENSLAEFDSENQSAKQQPALDILNAALLVSGTTIGGGFLALPTVVAPSGFYPSAVTLIGVWTYFLAQSFVLVECINRARNNNGGQQDQSQGVAATAKSVFGIKGEVTIGVLLAVLIQATLVSQISRAGMMFPNYRAGCLISALSIAAVVFGPRSGIIFASKANAVLTSLFLLSAMSVFGCGIQMADWSRLSVSNNWSSIPSAIPTFLQLLVYGEIVPSVCQILKYNTKHIHGAIILGSIMTLCLQIGWSGLGLSLVSSSAIDPVNVLLSSSGPVRIPLFCLAFTAILTTILGSYLALLSTVNDFLGRKEGKNNLKSYSSSISQRMKVASVITIPASIIACTSPTIFLQAIDFAGSYPVLMLWGIIPPVIALVQRFKCRRDLREGEVSPALNTAGPSVWVALLGSISLAMVGKNTFNDLVPLLKMI
jgi:tyrosine-specific transport protein